MMRLLVIIFGSVLILSFNPTAALDPLETDEEVFRADRLSAEAQTEYPNGVNVIPGDAETDYPVYHTIPKTSFSCVGRIAGFYADVEARCQAWHNCDTDSRMQSFLCPNGTIYSQTKRVCEWWYNVNCNPTEVSRNYEQNRDLFVNPRDQFSEDNESGKQDGSRKNGLIANSGPTKVRPQQQQQQQQQQNFNQNQGSRSPPLQQQNFNQQNFNQGSRPPPPPPQQQQNLIQNRPPVQQQNFNQGPPPQQQQQQNFNQNQGSRPPPPPQQQNFNQQNFNQNQGSRPQQQQQQNFNQGPPQQQRQQQRPQPQQVPSHLSAIVQAATGAVPQTTTVGRQQQQQPRRHPGDGQNFNRPNEFQNGGGNQNRGNQVSRNQVQQQQDNGQNYQQDRPQQQQQFQNQDQQQNNQRGQQQQQQQQQYRQNPDYNQNQRSQGNRQNSDNNPDQRQQQQLRPSRPTEDRNVPQPVQAPRQQQQQQQQSVVPVNRPNNNNNNNNNNNKPTAAPAQTFFIPPQMRFRHSTPRKHNIKFSSRLQEDESRERQIPSESQQQGFPYAQFVPQTYNRNFNDLVIPNNQYIIQNEQPQQFFEQSTTSSPPPPPPPPQQAPQRIQKPRPTESQFVARSPQQQRQQQQHQEIIPTVRQVPQRQQQQHQEIIPTVRQVPQRQNLQRSQQPSSISNPRVVPTRESYQLPVGQPVVHKERQEVQRPITPATPTTAAPVRRLPPPPEPATTYRPNPAAARIVVKARLENKHQVHEVRDSRPRDLPIYRAVAVQYPAPLDSSEEEEAAIHSSYTAGGKTYGIKQ